jgi:hypothetical protein
VVATYPLRTNGRDGCRSYERFPAYTPYDYPDLQIQGDRKPPTDTRGFYNYDYGNRQDRASSMAEAACSFIPGKAWL